MGLTEEPHTFRVRATDGVGNTGAPAPRRWTIDLTSPTTTVDSGPSSPTNSTRRCSRSAQTSPVRPSQCQLDGGGFAPLHEPEGLPGTRGGSHTFDVRATDSAGNTGSAAGHPGRSTPAAPDTTIGSGPTDPSGSGSATFTFSASEPGSTFACQLDGGGYTACTSPRTYTGPRCGLAHLRRTRDRPGRQRRRHAGVDELVDRLRPTDGNGRLRSGRPDELHVGHLHVQRQRARLDLRVPARRRRVRDVRDAEHVCRPDRGQRTPSASGRSTGSETSGLPRCTPGGST